MIIEFDNIYKKYVVWKVEKSAKFEQYKSNRKKDCLNYIESINKKKTRSWLKMLFKINIIFLILNIVIGTIAIILNCIAINVIIDINNGKEDLIDELEEKNYEL